MKYSSEYCEYCERNTPHGSDMKCEACGHKTPCCPQRDCKKPLTLERSEDDDNDLEWSCLDCGITYPYAVPKTILQQHRDSMARYWKGEQRKDDLQRLQEWNRWAGKG